MDAFQVSTVPNVSGELFSFAFVDIAQGIVATFDHVAGTGSISKRGAGRLRISGDSSPAGADISVVEGSVQIDGTYQNVPFESPGGGSSLNVFDVSGIGTTTCWATARSSARRIPSPPASMRGRLTVGTLSTSLEPTTLAIELAGTTPMVEYDQLVALNAAQLQGRSLDVDLLNGFDPALGTQFLILDNRCASAINGTFTGLAQDAVFFADGQAFQISYTGGTGNDVVLTAVVPEPATCSQSSHPSSHCSLGHGIAASDGPTHTRQEVLFSWELSDEATSHTRHVHVSDAGRERRQLRWPARARRCGRTPPATDCGATQRTGRTACRTRRPAR